MGLLKLLSRCYNLQGYIKGGRRILHRDLLLDSLAVSKIEGPLLRVLVIRTVAGSIVGLPMFGNAHMSYVFL